MRILCPWWSAALFIACEGEPAALLADTSQDVSADSGLAPGDALIGGPDATDGLDAADLMQADTEGPDVAMTDAGDTAGLDADSVSQPDAALPASCSGLSLVASTRTATDPCADDASPGTVVPDLGEVLCRDRVVDPTAPGDIEFEVRDGTLSNPTAGRDPIEYRAFVPARGPDATTRPALVVMLHGFSGNLEMMTYQSEYLASHGLAVLALTFPNASFVDPPAHDLKALEVRGAIDLALSAAGPFGLGLDPTKVAIAGHSLGGKIAFYTASLDDRVDLVLAMDPNNGGGPPCFIAPDGCNQYPVAPNCVSGAMGLMSTMRAESFVMAAEDALLTPDAHHRAVAFYRGAPSPAHLLHFGASGHADWIGETPTRDVSMSVMTALALKRFYGISSVDAWLPEGPALDAFGDLGNLIDERRSK
jgi:pimeloyl-ACP methyl ester carboxylesterase